MLIVVGEAASSASIDVVIERSGALRETSHEELRLSGVWGVCGCCCGCCCSLSVVFVKHVRFVLHS